jgi:hypothetical protein
MSGALNRRQKTGFVEDEEEQTDNKENKRKPGSFALPPN